MSVQPALDTSYQTTPPPSRTESELPRRMLNRLTKIEDAAVSASGHLDDAEECLSIFPSHDALCDRAVATIRRIAQWGLASGLTPDECRQIVGLCAAYDEADANEDDTVSSAVPSVAVARSYTSAIPPLVEEIETGRRAGRATARGSRP